MIDAWLGVLMDGISVCSVNNSVSSDLASGNFLFNL